MWLRLATDLQCSIRRTGADAGWKGIDVPNPSLSELDGSVRAQAVLDRPSSIAAASYLTSLTQLAINVQPVILGALAVGYGLGDRALGQLSAILVGCISITNLTAPFWVRRLNWRRFSLLAIVACSLVLAFGSAASKEIQFLAIFGLLGAVQGAVGVPSFASLGDTTNPERSYGICIIFQSAVAAIAVIPLTNYIIPEFGAPGMFLFLALIVATGALVCHWLPAQGRSAGIQQEALSEPAMPPQFAIAPLIGLLAVCVFTGGVLGFWYFIERIGAAHGQSPGFIGISLSLGSISTIPAAGLAAWLGGRVSNRILIVVGSAGLLIAFAVLQVPGNAAFLIANLLFSMSWALAQPPYWAIIRKIDMTNRLFVVATAAQGASGVAIGLVSGPIIEAGGYPALMAVSACLVVVGGLILGVAGIVSARLAGVPPFEPSAGRP